MAQPAQFQNIYYKRLVATAKPCYICYRPSTTVLSTLNATDNVYTCDSHLKDRGFATKLDSDQPTATNQTSPEEIERIKKEWEAKQAARTKDSRDEKDDSKKVSEEIPKSSTPATTALSPTTSPPPRPSHERFALHRDIYAMRKEEHRKSRQAKAAKDLAPRLPGAPLGAL